MTEVTPLGTILEGPQHRDAIHIAVAPVVAEETLYPGQHIGRSGFDQGVNSKTTPIGIVDPFLTHPVMFGQQFWIFLYPYTITSLRHAWTHPAFEEKPTKIPAVVGVPDYAPINSHQRQQAEALQRLENFADEAGIHYETLMDAARRFLNSGEWLCDGGRWEGFGVYDNFWKDYALVTGEKLEEEDPGNFFTCSC